MKIASNGLTNMKDFDIILMCALRYAFGRRTYVVPVVQEHIHNYLSEHPEMKEKFVKEIENLISERSRYDSCDAWKNMIKNI